MPAIDLTPGDLEALLRHAGVIQGGVRIVSLSPADMAASGLMGAVACIHIEYDPPGASGPRTLIAKTPSSDSYLSRAMSEIEVRFYAERLADAAAVRVPAAYYCRVDEPLLLLEDLGKSGFVPQLEGCSKAQAIEAMRAIATLHARWWNAPLPDALGWIRSPLDSPAGRFCAHWLASYQEDWPLALKPVPEVLRERYDEIGRRLASGPSTVVHGDFHSGNTSFSSDGAVTLIDFHRVERAAGMVDVARFLATSLHTETRRVIEPDLLRAYLQALEERGVKDYDMNTAVADLRPALLWVLGSPLALHIRGIITESRTWPTHFPILERCLTAIADWDALSEWT